MVLIRGRLWKCAFKPKLGFLTAQICEESSFVSVWSYCFFIVYRKTVSAYSNGLFVNTMKIQKVWAHLICKWYLKFILILITCICICVCVEILRTQTFKWVDVVWCGCRELDLSLLREQYILLAADPSLQPLNPLKNIIFVIRKTCFNLKWRA